MKNILFDLLEILFLILAGVALAMGDVPRAILSVVLALYFQLLQRPRA